MNAFYWWHLLSHFSYPSRFLPWALISWTNLFKTSYRSYLFISTVLDSLTPLCPNSYSLAQLIFLSSALPTSRSTFWLYLSQNTWTSSPYSPIEPFPYFYLYSHMFHFPHNHCTNSYLSPESLLYNLFFFTQSVIVTQFPI